MARQSAAILAPSVASPPLPLRRRGRLAIPLVVRLGIVTLVLFVVAAAFANLLAPYDPEVQQLTARLKPPAWAPGGSTEYLLGSDPFGRDLLSRVLYGARISLSVGAVAVIFGSLLGSLLGLISGYFGGRVDEVVMMLADSQLAVPYILLAIAVIAVLGPSFANLIVVLSISSWVTYARVVRSQVLSLREREFIEAARTLGASNRRILFRHVLPNSASPIIVLCTLELARVIQLEATLSFLGLGIPPPTPSWGGLLQEGRSYLATAWWLSTIPGLALVLVSLSVNRIGDWLRDYLDPALRGKVS